MRYVLAIMIWLTGFALPVSAQARLALVIGNSSYNADAGGQLTNPTRDADTIAAALRDIGFDVTLEKDLDFQDMRRALRDHRLRLEAAGDGAISFFYYAGHGANDSEGRYDGTNYLIPIGATLTSVRDLAIEAIELGSAIDTFARAGVSFVVFDACRNYPFSSTVVRSSTRGFTPEQEVQGTFIAFSSEPGSVAFDQSGYAQSLAAALRTPGLDHRDVFSRVRNDVYTATNREQFAWFRDGVLGDVRFNLEPASLTDGPPGGSERIGAGNDVIRAVQAAQNGDPVENRMFRDTLSGGSLGPRMVVVPAGTFEMGSPLTEAGRDNNEGPVRTVRIEAPFAVGVYEITFDDWDLCIADNSCGGQNPTQNGWGREDRGWGRGRQPVKYVSWVQVQTYLSWLNRQTGKGYRLLSEAEWEYVARANTLTPYWFGTDYDASAVADGSEANRTEIVGTYQPNAFGLYDTAGNVREWVEDCWHDGYDGAPNDGTPQVTGNCSRRVVRGGGYRGNSDLRSANRSSVSHNFHYRDLGFRIARDLR